jgi:hypothetical protein
MCLQVCVNAHLCACPGILLYVLFVFLSVCLSVRLKSLIMSDLTFTITLQKKESCLSNYLSICLFVYLFICPSVCQSVLLSVSLSYLNFNFILQSLKSLNVVMGYTKEEEIWLSVCLSISCVFLYVSESLTNLCYNLICRA